MRLDRIIAVRNDKTVYRDGDRCLKVFSETFSASQVLREAQLLASISEVGLPVPHLLSVTIWDGKWTIVTEYVHGIAMRQRMDADLPEQRIHYLASFVRIGEHIHTTACPTLPALCDKVAQSIAIAHLPERQKAFLHSLRSALDIDGDKICHGDFNPTNVVLTGGDGYRILDWSHATHGNPVMDAACTYLLLCRSDGRALADAYLTRYEKVTGQKNVRAYLPLAAVIRYVHANADTRAFLTPFLSEERATSKSI